jgi:hypothetical protein
MEKVHFEHNLNNMIKKFDNENTNKKKQISDEINEYEEKTKRLSKLM